MPQGKVIGSFASSGAVSEAIEVNVERGAFNVFFDGAGSGTIQLECQPPGATVWYPIAGAGGTVVQLTYAAKPYVQTVYESEAGVDYRLNCIAVSGGPINYRMSQ